MTHSRFGRSVLLSVCLTSIIISGCITISAPPSLTNKGKKSNVTQASYEEVLPQTPRDPANPEELKLAYARWMEELNQVVEARKHYSAVVNKEPANVQAILGLARLDQVTGQYADAEQKFKRAVRMAPELAEAQYGLGQFYTSQMRWNEALKHLSASLMTEPENVTYRYQLAVALVHTGDVDTALPHFIRTVGDAEGHYNVGLILNEEGHSADAERHFQLAVSKKPNFEQAEQWLGKLQQRRQGKSPEGLTLTHSEPSQVVPVGLYEGESGQPLPGDLLSTIDEQNLTPRQREQLQNQRSPSIR